MAAHVLRHRGGDLQIEEAVLPPVAVPGGFRKQIFEIRHPRTNMPRERNFCCSDGVGPAKLVAFRSFEAEVMHQPGLTFSDLAAKSNHAEDDELVTCRGVPAVMVSWLLLGAIELLNQGVVHLLVSVIEVLNARGLDVSCFETDVVREN